MQKEIFLLEEPLKKIHQKFIDKGWITIYYNHDDDIDSAIYCCIIKTRYTKKYMSHSNWDIHPGSEGRPSIITSGGKTAYHPYSDKEIEPFVYSKYFTHNKERYFDISEEFINYFKLYENGESKQNRTYYFIGDTGEVDEAIRIKPGLVTVKQKLLMEYISIRKVHLSICFDFMAITNQKPDDFDITLKQVDCQTEDYHYNHCTRFVPGTLELQNWIHGKVLIRYAKSKSQTYWFDSGMEDFESFIIGYDDFGDELEVPCNSEKHKAFVVTYFSKLVLDKYYNNPDKYTVSGYNVRCSWFSIKIDNHHDDYVAVFLNDLTYLPYKEQLHWKQYNIPPKDGISKSYYDTMVLGNWGAKSNAPDIRFKSEYVSFNKSWEQQFGWPFYRPLSGTDSKGFTALHLPSENNIKSFCEQVLVLVKLTIDSLNEENLVRNLPRVENEKGIAKLIRFLESSGCIIPDMIVFLRNLQDLRSGMIAHRFSASNKNCQKAIAYFGLKDDNYRAILKDIFIKSLHTLSTLKNYFIQNQKNQLNLD